MFFIQKLKAGDKMLKGDFHIHSTHSDGKLSIKKLIDLYSEKNYNVISITDHDNMNGCKEAIQYGKSKNLKVIAGIEISTKYNDESIHILGYFRDEDCSRKEIIDFSRQKNQDRINRCKRMVKALKDHFNIIISAEKLLSENKGGMIGRPHIANAIIDAGYETDIRSVFDKYIGNDSPVYMPSSCLTPQEGIDLLRNNNATIILAHPVLLQNSKIEDILNSFNFDGMEAIYSLNSSEDTIRLSNICKKRGLLITAGSDFHDFNLDDRVYIGSIALDNHNISKLLEAIYK